MIKVLRILRGTMIFTVTSDDGDGQVDSNVTIGADEIPDICPICHKHITPVKFATGFVLQRRLEMFLRCTNRRCRRAFIALYEYERNRSLINGQDFFVYMRSVPVEPATRAASEEIATLSPAFIRIWSQSQAAEDYGLEDVAGPGFRKALEFLVKDYAISLVTTEEERADIRSILLQPVIKKYLTGDKLPVVSSRAAWLGNDETHYERRWVGKDLQDLKKLINATEHFITQEIIVRSLPTQMPDPRAKPGP